MKCTLAISLLLISILSPMGCGKADGQEVELQNWSCAYIHMGHIPWVIEECQRGDVSCFIQGNQVVNCVHR